MSSKNTPPTPVYHIGKKDKYWENICAGEERSIVEVNEEDSVNKFKFMFFSFFYLGNGKRRKLNSLINSC